VEEGWVVAELEEKVERFREMHLIPVETKEGKLMSGWNQDSLATEKFAYLLALDSQVTQGLTEEET
jgi:hypothetical protein